MNVFGFNPKKTEVLNHWIDFVDGFGFPPSEFYAAVERELAALQVPSMEISRVEFAEGGILSSQRVYLRMIRERLAFDICAAPFGTGFFFSCRTVHTPAVVRWWHVIVVLGGFGSIYSLLARFLGPDLALVAVAGLVVAIVQMFRNTITLGLSDIDALLLKTPVIGPIYERWFRKETYYRMDTRLMYLDTVPRIVKRLADEFTGAKGIKLIRQYERAPILGELYKPVANPDSPK